MRPDGIKSIVLNVQIDKFNKVPDYATQHNPELKLLRSARCLPAS